MSITPALRFAILERDGFKCLYCGQPASEQKLQVDHVEPLASGGATVAANLVTSCWDCNAGKGTRAPDGEAYEQIRQQATPVVRRGRGRPPLGDKKRQKFSASMDPDVLARAKGAAGKGKLSAWLEAAAVAHLAKVA